MDNMKLQTIKIWPTLFILCQMAKFKGQWILHDLGISIYI